MVSQSKLCDKIRPKGPLNGFYRADFKSPPPTSWCPFHRPLLVGLRSKVWHSINLIIVGFLYRLYKFMFKIILFGLIFLENFTFSQRFCIFCYLYQFMTSFVKSLPIFNMQIKIAKFTRDEDAKFCSLTSTQKRFVIFIFPNWWLYLLSSRGV